MNIQIFSLLTAVAGSEQPMWSGDVDELADVSSEDDIQDTLEAIFRFFNRVDDADARRLESIGYRLPSLSVGDYVAFGYRCWQVAGTGFVEVTGNVDYLRSPV